MRQLLGDSVAIYVLLIQQPHTAADQVCRAYVGSAVSPGRRFTDHCVMLRAGCHHNPILQAAYERIRHERGRSVAMQVSAWVPAASRDAAELVAIERLRGERAVVVANLQRPGTRLPLEPGRPVPPITWHVEGTWRRGWVSLTTGGYDDAVAMAAALNEQGLAGDVVQVLASESL